MQKLASSQHCSHHVEASDPVGARQALRASRGVAKCTREEFGELLCQALSEYLGKTFGPQNGHQGYEPSTALAMAFALLRENKANLPPNMRRTLNNRISTTQLMGYTFDRNNADLVELTEECREALRKERKRATMATRPINTRQT